MGSDEVFVYGDEGFADILELIQGVGNAVRYGPLVMQLTGQTEGQDQGELQAAAAISILAQNVDLIDVPSLTIGFKLKDTTLAKEQLIKLETIGNVLFEANKQTQGRFKKTKIGDHEYLVLTLDGGMIPWDMAPLDKIKESEAEEGQVDQVVNRLKELKLAVAIGLRDNYLIVSIGSSTEGIEKLGGEAPLSRRPEFKPLAKHAGKRLVGIGYLSESMSARINGIGGNIDNMLEAVESILPATKLEDKVQERIRKDIEALADDVKTMLPDPGAMMGFAFLTDHGIESYEHAWGEHGNLDGSKPLAILNHVGGDPLFGVVGRGKVSVEDYDRVAKWVKVGYGYF
jgi:hypothetical protein